MEETGTYSVDFEDSILEIPKQISAKAIFKVGDKVRVKLREATSMKQRL